MNLWLKLCLWATPKPLFVSDDEEIQQSIRSFQAVMPSLAQHAKASNISYPFKINIIGPDMAAKIRELTGMNTLLLTRRITIGRMHYVLKDTNLSEGLLPITGQDFFHYPEAVFDPDWIREGESENTIVFEKAYKKYIISVFEEYLPDEAGDLPGFLEFMWLSKSKRVIREEH